MIKIKRIYEAADAGDGARILVDRLWPRGVSKKKAGVDLWLKGCSINSKFSPLGSEKRRLATFVRARNKVSGTAFKEIAPSDKLRKWFGHEPGKWPGFRRRYESELKGKGEEAGRILGLARKSTVTLLYAAKDEERNNAAALRDFLASRAG